MFIHTTISVVVYFVPKAYSSFQAEENHSQLGDQCEGMDDLHDFTETKPK